MAMNYMAIPDEWLEEMEELSDAEYGRLVRWGQQYHLTGEKAKLSGNERFYAKRVQMQIDRYTEHYNEISEKRRAAANAGKCMQMPANDSKCMETKTKTNTETKTNTSSAIAERSSSAQKRFAPPSVDEVRAYCLERGNSVDAQKFVDFYASKGWKVGNQSMKDWKAAVRTWEQREEKPKPKNQWVYDAEHDDVDRLTRMLAKQKAEAGA